MSLITGIEDMLLVWYLLTLISVILNIFSGQSGINNIKLLLLGRRKGLGKVYFIRNNKRIEELVVPIASEKINIPFDKTMDYQSVPSSIMLSGRNPAYIFREGEAEPLNPLNEPYHFDAKRIQQVIKMATLTSKLGVVAELLKKFQLLMIIILIEGALTVIPLIVIMNKMGILNF